MTIIREITIRNYRVFDETNAVFSLLADMRTKRLASNILKVDNYNVLKSIGLYGSNNSGKSSFVFALKTLRQIMLGKQEIDANKNIFTEDKTISFSITFNNRTGIGWLKYEVTFDVVKKYYVREKLSKIKKDNSGNIKEIGVFERDYLTKVFDVFGIEDSELLSSSFPLLYLLSSVKNEEVSKYRHELVACAESIIIVEMNNIPIDKTIEILKGSDERRKKFIREFVRCADLSLTDLRYEQNASIKIRDKTGNDIPEEVFRNRIPFFDSMRLVSTYNGKRVPSLVFDSTGTKRLEALAAYLISALLDGKVLVVDEIDSGLHFRITRAIVSLFNNISNTRGQLIFTTHDVTLLDTKYLMRKEQVYFINRDNIDVTVKSLADFTAMDGIRETTDLIKHYNRGAFSNVPNPHFVEMLIKITKEEK